MYCNLDIYTPWILHEHRSITSTDSTSSILRRAGNVQVSLPFDHVLPDPGNGCFHSRDSPSQLSRVPYPGTQNVLNCLPLIMHCHIQVMPVRIMPGVCIEPTAFEKLCIARSGLDINTIIKIIPSQCTLMAFTGAATLDALIKDRQ